MEEMKDPQELYSMALHEQMILCDDLGGYITVRRVPGGWLYFHEQFNTMHSAITTTFVPWNEDSLTNT